MSDFKAKCTKFSYSAPWLDLRDLLLRGGRGGEGNGREGRGREGRWGKGRKGRGK